MVNKPKDVIGARTYHTRSKHHLKAYAKGPATLDWEAQPDPFRVFAGSQRQALALGIEAEHGAYAELYRPGAITPRPLNEETLGAFFELSLGLSAWKQYGTDRWALRCNPSSGNLHPTEGYALLSGDPGGLAGVFHYTSYHHALEQRCQLDNEQAKSLRAALPEKSLLVGLSSIHWREAWKYGERAFRYSQLDTGHALACLRYAAAVLGWSVSLLDEWGDDDIGAVLGLDRAGDFGDAERESAELMVLVETQGTDTTAHIEAQALIDILTQAQWTGQANRLDPKPLYTWPAVDDIDQATKKPRTTTSYARYDDTLPAVHSNCTEVAATLIRQRRSAQAFDAQATLDAADFYALLDKLLPRKQVPPLNVLIDEPRIHPVLFVHRVQGLAAGLYALPRREGIEAAMREHFRDNFEWQRPEDCPAHLPLYRLISARSANAARTLSCHQAIAADGVFSLGMLAEFDLPLDEQAWRYRRLYWEAGVLGQLLYLEAEAVGLRGTGIGCFFDDAVHEVLGLPGESNLQSVYHFTLGAPLVDGRIANLPPYAHLGD